MAEQNTVASCVDITWLREAYFSDPDKQIRLEKGEVLLRPEGLNERLYLILEGTLVGYIQDDAGEPFEIFRSSEGTFVGVYSYFSKKHRSYSTVVAEAPCLLAYIDKDQPTFPDEQGRTFAEHFLPVIVHEIYTRQLLTQRVSLANQRALKHLLRAEKMATLGQLAAGLAHELNNAIGVIQRKTEWLADRLNEYLKEKDTRNMYPFFDKGFRKGNWLSSLEIRKRKRELERRYGMDPILAKKLAKIGLSEEEMKPLASLSPGQIQRINYYFETGIAMHDIQLAANHAAHVVRSVKELGAANRELFAEVDLNQTLHEALSLAKKYLSGVDVRMELGELPPLQGNPGDFVQVFLNIIKNAGESMAQDSSRASRLILQSAIQEHQILVEIIDNGPGIPPDIKDRIFQPNVSTKVQGLSFGLGLGLSIVQRLVESYGGHISVASRPGRTAFSITFPFDKTPTPHTP
ncbi:MAG: GHKL domain-containing protein [Bacteroidetes bacterium]|nr:MAG: GHKL domain-containing protein [Bacteroidota bacterium]